MCCIWDAMLWENAKSRVSLYCERKKLVTRKNLNGVGNHYEKDSKVSLNYDIKNSKDL